MTRVGSWVDQRRRTRRRRQLLTADPPAPPEGWVVAPPEVIGVGTQKSGTSWWWSLLADHPDLHTATGVPKELRYFRRFCRDPFTDEDARRYVGLFARPPGALAGEYTPHYSADPWTPPLLRRVAPDAVLLLMVRDPVERYRSGLDHARMRDDRMDAARHEQAFHRGLYPRQLAWLHRNFPVEQIVVLQYERCMRDTDAELGRTMRAIGLDPARHPGVSSRRVNETATVHPLGADEQRWLARAYDDDVRALAELTDAIDLALWPSFEHLAR